MIIYVLGILKEGNFTSINRNIDPNGKGVSGAAPEHRRLRRGRAKHKGLICVINDAIEDREGLCVLVDKSPVGPCSGADKALLSQRAGPGQWEMLRGRHSFR